jgi:cytochrome c oxidase subunit 2
MFHAFKLVSLSLGVALLLLGGCQWPKAVPTNTNSPSDVPSGSEADGTANSIDKGEPVPDGSDNAPKGDEQPTPENVTTPAPSGDALPKESAVKKQPTTKTFNLIASQWKFDPSEIAVNEGDTVVVNITSVDVPHGFAIPAFGVNVTIPGGETVNTSFVANKKGSYTFVCSILCGSGHSQMVGTLIVE